MVKLQKIFIPVICVASALFLASCEKASSPRNAESTTTVATNQQVFQVRGTIVEVKPWEKTVRIRHETITNYMDAMTMNFDVRDEDELRGLYPGNVVTFRMTVTDTDGWIDQIKKVGTTSTNGEPQKPILPPGIRIVRDVDPVNIGDALPDYRFTNQLGQAVNLANFKGQAFAFNFIFTRCPYPTFCPLMANNFRAVQAALLKMPNAPTNWHLFTISFDPEWDTPARLLEYAKNHGYNPAHWSFLTGDMIEISTLAEQVGQVFARDLEGGAGISHNLRTVVVDARGHVQNIIPENKWKPEELVEELIKAAEAK